MRSEHGMLYCRCIQGNGTICDGRIELDPDPGSPYTGRCQRCGRGFMEEDLGPPPLLPNVRWPCGCIMRHSQLTSDQAGVLVIVLEFCENHYLVTIMGPNDMAKWVDLEEENDNGTQL